MTYAYERFDLKYYDLAAFPGPKPGDMAEDFTVTTLDGREVRLSDYRGKWVVLETGSVTCNMYSRNIDRMAKIREKFKDVEFLVVYVREAHPGSKLHQHRSLETKRAAARDLAEGLGERRTILLDSVDGAMHRRYGALPNMIYVIDPHGRVIYRHDWAVPDELETVLAHRDKIYLNEHANTFELKPLDLKTNIHMFKSVLRGGWDAVWDLVKAIPRFMPIHLKVDREYRKRAKGRPMTIDANRPEALQNAS